MDDEAAFRACINEKPHDYSVYLVFADWLQERDDPRAHVYRLIGSFRVSPYSSPDNGWIWFSFERRILYGTYRIHPYSDLPDPWFNRLAPVAGVLAYPSSSSSYEVRYTGVLKAVDDAVTAYLSLTSLELPDVIAQLVTDLQIR